MTVVEDEDALVAVVAHGLLNAVYPALMAAQALQRPGLAPEVRGELVAVVLERTSVVVDTLTDLMRGVAPAGGDDPELISVRET